MKSDPLQSSLPGWDHTRKSPKTPAPGVFLIIKLLYKFKLIEPLKSARRSRFDDVVVIVVVVVVDDVDVVIVASCFHNEDRVQIRSAGVI